MNSLPLATIRDIFLLVVLAKSDADSVSRPLRLSHVSRQWREISLTYGELWSFLRINYRGDEDPSRRAILIEIFDTWLKRSDQSAINYSVSCRPSAHGFRSPEVHYVAEYMAQKLVSVQERWRDVQFTWEFNASSDLVGLHLTNMPTLRKFDFDSSIRSHNGQAIRPDISIKQSSKLEDIQLGGHFLLDCGLAPIPSIRSVDLQFSGPWQVWRAVSACLDLLSTAKHCTNFNATFEDTYFIFDTAEQHRHDVVSNSKTFSLECLSNKGYHCNITSRILDGLTLPSIESFYFDGWDDEGTGDALLEMFRRSSPPLLHLELRGDDCTDEDAIIPLLPLLPTLLTLDLQFPTRISKRFFEELTCNGNSAVSSNQILCPSLRRLQMNMPLYIDDGPSCVDAFCGMVESRCIHLGTFTKVRLHKVEGIVDAFSIRQYERGLRTFFNDNTDYDIDQEAVIVVCGDDENSLPALS